MLCEWRTGDAGPSAGDAEGRQAWEGGQDFLLCCWGGGKTSKVVIVGSYSLSSCADSDWPDWDQGSAMPHASLRSAERGSLPALAAAGTHQLCLSVKVALQEWRLRGKLLSWSTIFPKSFVQEPRFILLEPCGGNGPSQGSSPAHCGFNYHHLSLRYQPVGKGIHFFLKGNGWFHFLIYESTFDCKICTRYWAQRP